MHFLARPEIEAILAPPDRATWLGRRDYTLLLVAAQTGLRLSELTGLDRDAVHLGSGAHVRCVGNGRKERITPLTTLARGARQASLKEPVRKGATRCSRTCKGAGSVPIASALCWRSMFVSLTRMPVFEGQSMSPHVLRHSDGTAACRRRLLRDSAVARL
ncbi:tyrosine-type recombinase/integrase [Bradyrhizobium forestalis]|uniref:tyrosine-type recombinase/integrase n=1 Tax=Bradyrhizobium forestalis TaxID=1419263 RepID=UPI003D313E7B